MLTASAKIQAADQLRRMAAELERQAGTDQQILEARAASKRHRRRRRQVIDQIARMLAAEISPAAIATRFPDFEPEQIGALIDRARAQAQRIRTAERNREISRLAQRGWTNAQLAERFQISQSQITRILSDAWRRPR